MNKHANVRFLKNVVFKLLTIKVFVYDKLLTLVDKFILSISLFLMISNNSHLRRKCDKSAWSVLQNTQVYSPFINKILPLNMIL